MRSLIRVVLAMVPAMLPVQRAEIVGATVDAQNYRSKVYGGGIGKQVGPGSSLRSMVFSGAQATASRDRKAYGADCSTPTSWPQCGK
jgi:hypothetical protein